MRSIKDVTPYKETPHGILDALNVTAEGLSDGEVASRREAYGENKLKEPKQTSIIALFFRQFASPLIYVLLIASLIVFFIGERIDGSIILAVLVINAFLGMYQEGKAENTLKALREFTKTETRVKRGGREKIVFDTEIVLGDIILLSEGDKVPADARIIKARGFKVDESALTGESIPIDKQIENINKDLTDTNQMINMVFKGTFVVGGTAECIVTSVGKNTVIGSLSEELSSITSDVPLKKNIEHIAKVMTIVILIVSVLIFGVGLFLGNTVSEMFLTSVAIAVSVIPEGLPIVITLVLATGVYRMSKRNALVKKLQAVEALGRADVICVDKTGTITKNELMVSEIFINNNLYTVTGSGYESNGEVIFKGDSIDPANHKDILFAGKIASFCANASVSFREKEKMWKVIGDPTEASLLILGEKIGFKKDILEKEEPQIFDIPFSQENKYHGTIHKTPQGNILTVVGAPETIIEKVKYIYNGQSRVEIKEEDRENLKQVLHKMAEKGLRVIGFSVAENVGEKVDENNLPELTFIGLYGLSDTLREGVRESVLLAKNQGIKVALITGDHKKTAEALASMAGIWNKGDDIIVGSELRTLDDNELEKRLAKTTVFARVSPQDKLRIVELFRRNGDIVAMTGDGVNDALSLVAADLGIAMGKIGTEVTKEAADIVLLDDNFNSIVGAIEEGRSIFSAIKKVLLYLFSTGFGELFTIVFALIALMPLPLLPSQIIWLNLVTDSFLVIAFAFEPKKKLEAVQKKNSLKKLIDAVVVERVLIMSLVMALGSIFIFAHYKDAGDIDYARTMTLTLLAVYQWINVWNCRSENKSIFRENPISNMYFVYALVIVASLHFLLIYTEPMQALFKTVPMTLSDWGVVALFALPLIAIEEIRKGIHNFFAQNQKKGIVKQ